MRELTSRAGFQLSLTTQLFVYAEEGAGSYVFSFLKFVIMFNNLVPISLMVSIEIVKYVQAIFINTVSMTTAVLKAAKVFKELMLLQPLEHICGVFISPVFHHRLWISSSSSSSSSSSKFLVQLQQG